MTAASLHEDYATFTITSPNPTQPLMETTLPKISLGERCKNYFSSEKSAKTYLGWGISFFLIGIGFCSYLVYENDEKFSPINAVCKIGCFLFWCSSFICFGRLANKIHS